MELEESEDIIVDSSDSGIQTDVQNDRDAAEEIMAVHDKLSLDVLLRNIAHNFENPSVMETIDYIAKFEQAYVAAAASMTDDFDKDILESSSQQVMSLVEGNLEDKYLVSRADSYALRPDSTIGHIETLDTLYTFFVVRHYTNVRDYFRMAFRKKKVDFVTRYQNIVSADNSDDLFVSQDKHKYSDHSDVILLNAMDGIIGDIREEAENAGSHKLFNDICAIDLFEEMNQRMAQIIAGGSYEISDDYEAAVRYLGLLDDPEILSNIKTDLTMDVLENARLSDKEPHD